MVPLLGLLILIACGGTNTVACIGMATATGTVRGILTNSSSSSWGRVPSALYQTLLMFVNLLGKSGAMSPLLGIGLTWWPIDKPKTTLVSGWSGTLPRK